MASYQSFSTFNDYVDSFRSELHSAASKCLSTLAETIKTDGDDWMEMHLESILGGPSGGPIVELLKTPSRTATIKKTRAKLEADKQRTDKIKGLNARLALSPLQQNKINPARQLFSPLQSRSLNVASPSPAKAAALASSPAKTSKSSQPVVGKKAKATKGKAKGKKGKAQDENQENEEISGRSVQSQSTESSKGDIAPAPVPTAAKVTSPSRAPKSPQPLAQQVSLSAQATGLHSDIVVPLRDSDASTARSTSLAPTTTTAPTDLSMIAEAEDERSTASLRSVKPSSETTKATSKAADPKDGDTATKPIGVHGAGATQTQATSIAVALPMPVSAPAPAPVPVRQVRSSWLSKALGTGSIPIAGLPDITSGYRKSVAAPAQKPFSTNEYEGLRKSLAPVGGLKRKSDEGLDDDEDEDHQSVKRPEKHVKIDAPLPTPSVLGRPPFDRLTSATDPSTISRPTSAAATAPLSAGSATTSSTVKSNSALDQTHPRQSEHQRSEISKVTKALEDMRERTQAKELAKQKAAAQAVLAKSAATSTGAGFLRGVANLTRSFGLGGSKAEEDVEKTNRELEEDRQAQREAEERLRKLMEEGEEASISEIILTPDTAVGVSKPIPTVPVLAPVVSIPGTLSAARSTTPDLPPPPSTHGTSPLVPHATSSTEEEEVEEEEEVIEAIELDEKEPERKLPPRAATPAKPANVRVSTTPTTTPPRGKIFLAKPVERITQPTAAPLTKAQPSGGDKNAGPSYSVINAVMKSQPVNGHGHHARQDVIEDDDDDAADGDREDLAESFRPIVKAKPANAPAPPRAHPATASSAKPSLAASTASQGTTSTVFSQAAVMAGKALGVKPAIATVKSLELAASAARREQENAGKRSTFKDNQEARRLEVQRKRAEEEKRVKEAQMRQTAEEIRKAKQMRAMLAKQKAEKEDKMILVNQQKIEAEARLKAEEEANRKRKMAASTGLTKSQSQSQGLNPAKRVAAPAASGPSSQFVKGKEPMKPILKLNGNAPKLGPNVFRTAPPPPDVAPAPAPAPAGQSGTISLVGQPAAQNPTQQAPRPLGPPSRPSAMLHQQQVQVQVKQVQSTAVHRSSSAVLQQQRAVLQTQIDQHALEVQSEDIVLPDIASEYSNSDDSDRDTGFERPGWAESPELRAALERQATRNPDELFGPIKPLSMEELFKVKAGRFRPRTSSANWASGDGVTKKEELDYARRMGFKAPPA